MSFARQGFAVVPDLLSPQELALARELARGLLARHRSADGAVLAASVSIASVTKQHPQRNPGVLAWRWESEPYVIGDLVALDPKFARVLSAEAIWLCAAELLACSMEEVVFHFSNITRKPSGIGPAVGWHRDADNKYCSAAGGRTVRLLLPLQDMSEANGGTAVLPRSHVDLARDEAADRGAAVHPSVAAGSGLALHAELLHGGFPNRSASERDVIVLQLGVSSSALRYRANELLSLSGRERFIQLGTASVVWPCRQGSSITRGERVEALKSVLLSIGAGEAPTFLGPKGAGKTTTIRMITGLLRDLMARGAELSWTMSWLACANGLVYAAAGLLAFRLTIARVKRLPRSPEPARSF